LTNFSQKSFVCVEIIFSGPKKCGNSPRKKRERREKNEKV
jgi:hypothetical protein